MGNAPVGGVIDRTKHKETVMASTRAKTFFSVAIAALYAEILPIVALFVVVFVYGIFRSPESMSPPEFAPLAGAWVGPIGGFLATMFFAWRLAKHQLNRNVQMGLCVGVATAALDIVVAFLLVGSSAIQPLILLSNCGRIIAGGLGGWLAGFGKRGDV
jgi:hypothetical protein